MEDNKDTSRAPGKDRKRELVQIAYRHIAEKGFEGLRFRNVAAEAGINNATLHYYYPTKEALIQGVVDYLLREFQTSRVPQTGIDADDPLETLRREYEDIGIRVRETPEMFVVLAELHVRSRRDPAIAAIFRGLHEGWRGYLSGILDHGMRTGAFRSDLDTRATAEAIMAQLMAIGYLVVQQPDAGQVARLVSQLAAQTERWVKG